MDDKLFLLSFERICGQVVFTKFFFLFSFFPCFPKFGTKECDKFMQKKPWLFDEKVIILKQ